MSGLSFFKWMHLRFMFIWNVWITLFTQLPRGVRRSELKNWDEVQYEKEFVLVFCFGHWKRNEHKFHSAIWLLLDLLQRSSKSELPILSSTSLRKRHKTISFSQQEFFPLWDREPAEKKPGDNCDIRRRCIIQNYIWTSFLNACNCTTHYTFTNFAFFSYFCHYSHMLLLSQKKSNRPVVKPFERRILSQLYLWLNTEHH